MIGKTNKRATVFERDVTVCLILDAVKSCQGNGEGLRFGGAASAGRGDPVGSAIFKCLLESSKPEIVVEFEFSIGLGRLWPQQQPVTVYTQLAYIQTKSPGLASRVGGGGEIQAA